MMNVSLINYRIRFHPWKHKIIVVYTLFNHVIAE